LRDNTSWTLKFPYIRNDIYGMSIFVTSPYLLCLFMQKWSSFDARARRLLVAALASGLLVFSYFGVGLVQFGYRYSLDFLPEVFLVFMITYRTSHKRLSRGMKTLLLSSGIVNFYLLWPLIIWTLLIHRRRVILITHIPLTAQKVPKSRRFINESYSETACLRAAICLKPFRQSSLPGSWRP